MLAMIAAKLPLLLQVAPTSPDQMTAEQFNRQIVLEAVRNGPPGGAGILIPIMGLGIVSCWLSYAASRGDHILRHRASGGAAGEFPAARAHG
jgi:hypothetical protein